ncbi:hypothetical protein ILYODFUR_019577 [Ilyodon furcidens]|uniref:Ig-like domain-containing protein n=1 Tax=Ilyodon furcidens TaxID=33524 RepID=A0ABV0SMN0_9TELE
MERLVLVSLSILTFTGKSFGDEHVHVKYQEDEDVTLPCTFSTSLTDSRIDWKQDGKNGRKDVFLWEYGTVQLSSQDEHFKDRVSHFPDKIKHGNASIIIKNAKVSDSGTYTCLYVNRGETDPEEYHKVILTVGHLPFSTALPLLTMA